MNGGSGWIVANPEVIQEIDQIRVYFRLGGDWTATLSWLFVFFCCAD